MKIDFKKVKVIEVDGINHYDYPEYCDAYISEANYNGKPVTDEQLDEINDNDQFRYESVWEFIND